jgi:hypothetical protein
MPRKPMGSLFGNVLGKPAPNPSKVYIRPSRTTPLDCNPGVQLDSRVFAGLSANYALVYHLHCMHHSLGDDFGTGIVHNVFATLFVLAD